MGVNRNRKVQCMAKREGKVSKLPKEGLLHRPGGAAAFSQFPNCSNQTFSATSAPGVARNLLEQQELMQNYQRCFGTAGDLPSTTPAPELHPKALPSVSAATLGSQGASGEACRTHPPGRKQAAHEQATRCTARRFAPLIHPPEPQTR